MPEEENAATTRHRIVSLQNNDRHLKAEIERHTLAIGKRVRTFHRRARDTSPFGQYRSIMSHLKRISSLEHAYHANRMRLDNLRREVRGGGK